MWIIRVLTGTLAGRTLALPPGKTVIGRSSECHLIFQDKGISKRHAEIYAMNDKVVVTDLNSSNGTFVNGVRIQSKTLLPTDKVSFHDVIIDVQPVTPELYAAHQRMMSPPMAALPGAMSAGVPMNAPGAMPPQYDPHAGDFHPPEAAPENASAAAAVMKNPKERLTEYVENVALPGVYKLAEISEFKWVLGGFVLAYIVAVTALSMVPMVMVTKSSIELESQRRALTIARNMAKQNEAALLQNLESAVTVQSAQLEEGVEKALIVSHVDGHIIAPVNLMGEFAQKSFIHSARQKAKEMVTQLESDKVGAAVPIAFYNPATGGTQISAWAIVVYDMGALAFDDGRTISMFVQTLAMALIIGGILFFFMYKLVEYPIRNINKQIDVALKEGSTVVQTKFQFPVLHELCANISSALNRAVSGPGDGANAFVNQVDREMEADNMLKIIPCPAMAISSSDRTVISVNGIFESEIGVSLADLKQQGIDAIPDQAFQLNLVDLVERVQQQSEMIASNQLEFSGINCELLAQAIHGNNGPAYFIITIQPTGDYSEEVA